jgi:hypothetical protein
MRSIASLATVVVTLVLFGCDQRQGICIDQATTSLPEMCSGAQKNTCEKTPGSRWQAFKNDKAFDKATDSCGALGYTARGPGGASFVKPGVR